MFKKIPKTWRHRFWLLISTMLFLIFVVSSHSLAQEQIKEPATFGITINPGQEGGDVAPAIKIVSILTILSIAPAILLMMTSFTRIVIVLGFIRLALGTQTMPPNQVIIGLSLFLTFFTMSPILDEVKSQALDPYLAAQIDGETAISTAMAPIRQFMLNQTREADLGLFYKISGQDKPFQPADIPTSILLPAFMISELKTAFNIGFIIYIPFLIIDMVISSILMAMGMMMLPPTVVSLPFKLVLFVLVDGWSLIVNSLISSFHIIT